MAKMYLLVASFAFHYYTLNLPLTLKKSFSNLTMCVFVLSLSLLKGIRFMEQHCCRRIAFVYLLHHY